MGYFRFRRRIRIAPGMAINLSKSGTSLSLGQRGAHVTIGRHGTRTTVGIPGTGFSYTSYSRHHARRVADKKLTRTATPPSVSPEHKPREPWLPSKKIGIGLAWTIVGLVLLAANVGVPFILVGLIMVTIGLVQRRQPKWRTRALLRRAKSNPAKAELVLEQAVAVDSCNPEALGACAEWHFQNQNWERAAELYDQYFHQVPTDSMAETCLGLALVNASRPDEAVPHLEKSLALPFLTEGQQHSARAALALAFLKKGDARQALELAKAAPLHRHQLDAALMQCLLIRGLAFLRSWSAQQW